MGGKAQDRGDETANLCTSKDHGLKEKQLPVTPWFRPWAPAPAATRGHSAGVLRLPATGEAPEGGHEDRTTHRCFLRYSCSAFSATVSMNFGLLLETSSGTVTVMGSASKSFTTTSVTREGASSSEVWVVTWKRKGGAESSSPQVCTVQQESGA